jgi:hypothetical protein
MVNQESSIPNQCIPRTQAPQVSLGVQASVLDGLELSWIKPRLACKIFSISFISLTAIAGARSNRARIGNEYFVATFLQQRVGPQRMCTNLHGHPGRLDCTEALPKCFRGCPQTAFFKDFTVDI